MVPIVGYSGRAAYIDLNRRPVAISNEHCMYLRFINNCNLRLQAMSVVGLSALAEEAEVVEIAARAPTRRLTPRMMMSCQKAFTPSDQETVRVGKITTFFGL